MLKIRLNRVDNKLRYLIFLLAIILMAGNAVAQKQPRSYVKITGNVKEGKKSLTGVTIDVFDGPTKSGTVTSKTLGRFAFNLNFDKIYIVFFKKSGFVTKKVEINTFVEEKDINWSYTFEMQMIEMVEGLDISPLKQPVAKIVYDESEGDFAFDEVYLKTMQAKLTKMMAQQKKLKSKQYSNIIASADNNFRNKNYEKAITLYEKALDLDPYADHPYNQIDKCEQLMRAPKVNTEDYKKVILMADESFKNKDYIKAIGLYEQAMDIDPYADYPDNQIDKCDAFLAQLKNVDKNYNNAITKANRYFTSKNYENAKTEYNNALAIKSGEAYPKNRIIEIDKLLAEAKSKEAAAKDLAAKEAAAKELAAKEAAAKELAAKEAAAKDLAAKEAAAKELAAKEAAAAAALASKEKLDEEYNKLISSADRMLNAKNYTGAKTKYVNASSKKPDKQYPKDKIAEIDKVIADKAAVAKKEADFQKIIAKADALLDEKKYKESRTNYIEASNIKSNDYTKGRIAQLDKLIAEQDKQDALNNKYNTAISEAGVLYKAKNYSEAKLKYNEALKIKPTSSFAKSRINSINSLLSQQATNKKYTAAIKKADALFKTKKYTEAKASYLTASKLKTSVAYPKQQIAKIQKLLYNQNMNKPEETKPEEKDKLADIAVMSKDSKKKYLSELSKNYPDRKTVENSTDANKTKIIRIIMNETGSAAHEYRKLVKTWGGVYYYKDGIPVSEIIFYNETK